MVKWSLASTSGTGHGNWYQMVALDENSGDVITIYPKVGINMITMFHANASNSLI